MIEDQAWSGHRCFIVGGGTSLKGFNFAMLQNEKVIAVNRAFEFCPFAKIVITIDSCFYNWLWNGTLNEQAGYDVLTMWKRFQGHRVVVSTNDFQYGEDVILLDWYKRRTWGLSPSLKKGLCTGKNSGYTALNLAILLGANPIYLLGFDMKHSGKDTHFHNGYMRTAPKERYIEYFEGIAEDIKAMGIQVFNVNTPDKSKLRCFNFVSLEPEYESKKPFVIVSFYTLDYKREAKKLRESIKKWGLESDIVEVKKETHTRSQWKDITLIKASFIREMMLKHKGKNIVWTDADSEFKRSPELFYYIKNDIAAHHREREDGTKECLSGTLFFRNLKRVEKIVDKWIALNKKKKEFYKSDQINLGEVLDNSNINIYPLPHEYVSFDIYQADHPVIQHYQASRRFR